MISYDEIGIMLDEIAGGIPDDLFRELNGGVILLPDTQLHPESGGADNLYILGQYHNQPRGLGRYITIYYGSFIRVYGYCTPDRQKEELKKIVFHEFRHHLESLAGDRSLEIQDAVDIAKYKNRILKNFKKIKKSVD